MFVECNFRVLHRENPKTVPFSGANPTFLYVKGHPNDAVSLPGASVGVTTAFICESCAHSLGA